MTARSSKRDETTLGEVHSPLDIADLCEKEAFMSIVAWLSFGLIAGLVHAHGLVGINAWSVLVAAAGTLAAMIVYTSMEEQPHARLALRRAYASLGRGRAGR